MTAVGELGHALPYLIPDFWTATVIARAPRNLAAAPAAEMMKSFVLSKSCRNQLAPFDVLVEPVDGLPTLST